MATTVIATNSGARIVQQGNQLVVTRTGTVTALVDGSPAVDARDFSRIVVDGGVYGGDGSAIVHDGSGNVEVVVGLAGTITAPGSGIVSFAGPLAVTNAGFIDGGLRGVYTLSGALSLVNAGTISGTLLAVQVENAMAPVVIVNAGVLAAAAASTGAQGAVAIESTAGCTLLNSGTILGGGGFGVRLEVAGDAFVVNDGRIISNNDFSFPDSTDEALSTGGGDDTVVNRGDIEGGEVRLGAGNDIFDGQAGRSGGRILLDLGNDTAFGGELGERIDAGGGNDLVVGAGGDDQVDGGTGNDTLAGETGADTLLGNIGIDILLGAEGDDRLDGGANDDLVDGAEGRDTLLGGDGADDIAAGSGDDLVEGGAGADLLSGGEGARDILSYATSTLGVTVNLSTGDAAAGHAEGDVFAEFEGAWGSGLADSITGSLQANTLRGLSGDDRILGLAGNDRMLGDGGNDTLTGGAGQDLLFGGSGVDRFVFALASDTGVTGATRDWIMDFSQPLDERIDLGAIDANTGVGGNQGFAFIGAAAFSGAAGELRSTRGTSTTLVQGDVNGDAIADFTIMLRGAYTLAAGDFVLGLGLGG